MKIKDRFTNPYFVCGLVGVFFMAAGIDLESLTSWNILAHNLVEIVQNPFLLGSVIMAVVGVFVDPSTQGFKDQPRD